MRRQHQRILQYVDVFGSITSYEACVSLGIMELPKRIGELEDMGYRFDRRREGSLNRFGEKVSYNRYRLASEPQEVVA